MIWSDILHVLPTFVNGLLVFGEFILRLILLLYLLRIARWYVREHDVPRLFAKRKKAERPPEGDGE